MVLVLTLSVIEYGLGPSGVTSRQSLGTVILSLWLVFFSGSRFTCYCQDDFLSINEVSRKKQGKNIHSLFTYYKK